ncbi:MAG: helix-turn-helix domain-containing protein [Lachnospiraceae bacterium]|nr:helix-turn-helix domain-containing protein [Lachnospiraceae bacterium]
MNDDERRALEDLSTSHDVGLSLRAKIILSFSALQQIKAVASEIGVCEKTVSNWISRYQENGLEGLRVEKPGQSQSERAKTDLLTKQVMELRDDGTTSAKDIAAALGISVSAVYRSYTRAGISTNDKLQSRWFYVTVDRQVGSSPYLAAVYLSYSVKFIVLCETSEQLKGTTIHGVVSTRDKSLSKEMEQSAVTLRMVDTVVAAKNHISFTHAGSGVVANQFLTETIDGWPQEEDYRFHVIALGDVRYTGMRMKGIHYSWAEDMESWMNLVLQPYYGVAHSDEYDIVIKDLKILKSYVAVLRPDSDPYTWRMLYGNYSPLTTMLTSPKEVGCIGDDLESLEDAVKALFPNGISGEAPSGGTMVGSIIVMQDSSGQLTYRPVSIDGLFPEISEDIGTPEGFDHMINDLDRKMTTLAHKIDLAGRDLYLTNIKKRIRPWPPCHDRDRGLYREAFSFRTCFCSALPALRSALPDPRIQEGDMRNVNNQQLSRSNVSV